MYMWSLCTCDLYRHVVFIDMWSLCTCGLYRHVVFIDMWSLQTCGLFEHVVFMYMWSLWISHYLQACMVILFSMVCINLVMLLP